MVLIPGVKASAQNLIVNGTTVDTAFPIAPLD
jgi:hypothetical protein